MNYTNPFEVAVTGQQLKDWIWSTIINDTGYAKIAKAMKSCFNLDNDKYYMAKMCGEVPKIIEVDECGKKYEIPCE